jgi:DNA-binding Xre family transcriptional regulator
MEITIINKLPELAAQRGIRSQGLAELMTGKGYSLSRMQASRYLSSSPPAMNIIFVSAICNVFQCAPNDLYQIIVTLEADEDLPHSITLSRNTIVQRKRVQIANNLPAHNPPEKLADNVVKFKAGIIGSAPIDW